MIWINSDIIDDLNKIINNENIKWDRFKNKTVFITGGTGLIGSTLVKVLIYANEIKSLNCRLLILVRDDLKAHLIFKNYYSESANIKYIKGSIENFPLITDDIDYIIHCANPTSSNFFIEKPVETIKITYEGTSDLLELGKLKSVEGIVFLSSMEIYGPNHSDVEIKEDKGAVIDTMIIRNCYPEAKRLCENLCAAYYAEYSLPTFVVRLAQCFGPGVDFNDQRVFAEFARDIINKDNIVLKSLGESKRCYIYTFDAASAILTILSAGKPGIAYNVANTSTYCSILDMANMVAKEIANNEIRVIIPSIIEHQSKYSATHKLKLNIDRLLSLGWKPTRDLKEMFQIMIASFDR